MTPPPVTAEAQTIALLKEIHAVLKEIALEQLRYHEWQYSRKPQ
jgi:hypothetical protein